MRSRAGDGGPLPLLATSWASADRRRWTLTLRAGVRFHDGAPLDADAVVANLDDLRRHGRFEGTAQRVGPLVVGIQLPEPNAALLSTLSQPFLGIQSPRQLGSETGLPACTGPFRVAAHRPGEIRLERFDGYWGAPAASDAIVFREFATEAAVVEALRAGRVHVAPYLAPRTATGLRADPSVRVRSWTGLNLGYLALNNERVPFGDRRVRHAIARAVDRGKIVRDVLGGHGEPARNPLPPGVAGYATRTRELSLDRRLARRLLSEAGHGSGLRLTLLTTRDARPTMPEPLAVAEHVRQDLAAVGVDVRVVPAPTWPAYLEQVTAGAYDLALLGWEADTLDANDFLAALVARSAIGHTNRSRYASDAMEALLRRGRRGADPRERQRTYAEAQQLFQREMPWVPLFHVSAFLAVRAEVRDVEPDPTGILRYARARRQP